MTGEMYRTRQVTTPRSAEADGSLSGYSIPLMIDRRSRAARLGGVCLAVVLSAVSTPGLADSNVFVNEALLDGITQQGVPVLPYGAQGSYAGQPGYNAGGSSTTIVGTNQDGSQYYVTRPSTLLFPPPQFPRSRVTIIDSGTASAGGSTYSSNSLAPLGNSGGTATQSASRLVPPSSAAGTGQKAESRLLVPLPPTISQQAATPKAPAIKTAPRTPAKAQPVPQPPKQVAKVKAPELPKAPEPPKKTVPVPATPTPKAAPAAPKIAAAPPPPKLVPKKLAEASAPKVASVGTAPRPKAPSGNQLTDTTSALTPPPPPPPVTPSGAAASSAAAAGCCT